MLRSQFGQVTLSPTVQRRTPIWWLTLEVAIHLSSRGSRMGGRPSILWQPGNYPFWVPQGIDLVLFVGTTFWETLNFSIYIFYQFLALQNQTPSGIIIATRSESFHQTLVGDRLTPPSLPKHRWNGFVQVDGVAPSRWLFPSSAMNSWSS